MFVIAWIGVIIAIIAAIMVWRWNRMPRKAGPLGLAKFNRDKIKSQSIDNQRKKEKLVMLGAEICRDFKIFPYSKEYEEEVNKMIVAMDLKVNGAPMRVDNLYLKQCLFGVSSIGVAILVVAAMSISFGTFMPVGFLAIAGAPALFKVPFWQLRADFKEEQLTAMSQWLEFYNMYYSQFIQRECSVQLLDIVDNFLPLSNLELSKILKRFRTDLENGGDEYGLDRLKARYPDNMRIHKFVSAAKMRINGDESSFDLMRSVQDNLLFEEDQAYQKDLNFRYKKTGTVVNIVLYISLAMLFGVMIYAMVA